MPTNAALLALPSPLLPVSHEPYTLAASKPAVRLMWPPQGMTLEPPREDYAAPAQRLFVPISQPYVSTQEQYISWTGC